MSSALSMMIKIQAARPAEAKNAPRVPPPVLEQPRASRGALAGDAEIPRPCLMSLQGLSRAQFSQYSSREGCCLPSAPRPISESRAGPSDDHQSQPQLS
jgi:hypothetical protein